MIVKIIITIVISFNLGLVAGLFFNYNSYNKGYVDALLEKDSKERNNIIGEQ